MMNPTTPDDDMEHPDYNEDLFLQENWPETDPGHDDWEPWIDHTEW
jgi:hypothetical protein